MIGRQRKKFIRLTSFEHEEPGMGNKEIFFGS